MIGNGMTLIHKYLYFAILDICEMLTSKHIQLCIKKHFHKMAYICTEEYN